MAKVRNELQLHVAGVQQWQCFGTSYKWLWRRRCSSENIVLAARAAHGTATGALPLVPCHWCPATPRSPASAEGAFGRPARAAHTGAREGGVGAWLEPAIVCFAAARLRLTWLTRKTHPVLSQPGCTISAHAPQCTSSSRKA